MGWTHNRLFNLPWLILLSTLTLSTVNQHHTFAAAAKPTTPLSEKPCTIYDQDRKFYDLNPLKANKEYQIKTEGGHDFILNVCKNVSYKSWHLDVPHPETVGGFIRRDNGDFSVGMSNTTLAMTSGDILLLMTSGSPCPNSPQHASTIIQFICDTSVFAAGTPRLVGQFPTGDENAACSFFIEWKTHYACPVGDTGGLWGFLFILIIALTILLAVYVLLSVLYNRYVLQLRGRAQLPGFSWQELKEQVLTVGEWVRSVDMYGRMQGGGGGGGYYRRMRGEEGVFEEDEREVLVSRSRSGSRSPGRRGEDGGGSGGDQSQARGAIRL